jgi:PAS domain S-box-containing protein
MPVFDQKRVEKLKQILKWHPRGITISDLAVKMEMNRNLVAKYLDILLISGQVEMQEIGAAKVYFLSNRVPISSMLEFSSDMLIILDSALTIIQINEPLLVQINDKKEALAGRNIRDIDHPFIRAIPVILPSKGTDQTHDQVHEFECTFEGKKHYYKIKQLQTAFEDGSQGITLIIEDITAQVTYQEILELNEAKYRGIVEDQTEFITRFLPDGSLVFVNDAYARYLGKEKEGLLGMQHIPGIDNDDRTTVHECIQSLDAENPVTTFECRIHLSIGENRWNLWTVRALVDENQKSIEYQGVGRDNTEKREAATRINQYVRDMEFLSRKAQEFVEISPEANIFRVIGQGISEIIPDSLMTVNSIDVESDTLMVMEVLPERDRGLLKKYIGRDLLGFQFNFSSLPEPHKLHFLSTQEAGKLVRVEENLHMIFFQQIPQDTCDIIKNDLNLGDSLYTIGLTRHGILFGNVSFSLRNGETLTNSSIIETYVRQAAVVLHRRRTDDALKASESRYRGIVEDQTEFVARFLPDGTLTYVNDSLCRFFFLVRTELLGQSFFSLSQIPKDDHNALIRDLQTLDARNPVCSTEFRIINPPDGVRWTQWTYRALFDDHGTIIECQGVGRDITEQKEAEAKNRQYIADIEYLSQKSYEFLELTPEADIYGTICGGVKAILPTAVVIINSVDPITSLATTQCVLGDEERDVFRTLIGKEVIGMKVKLPEPDELQKERMAVMSRKLTKVPGNLFITMHNHVPEEICTKIEEALNIGDIYAIGLVSQGVILASVVIMLRKGEIITHNELIESYITHASIALLRYKTEKTLKKSEKLYRSVIENIQDVFYRSDKAGNLIMASPSWAKILGYDSLDDCIGHNIAEKFYYEPERRKEFLESVYRHGSVSDYDVVLKSRVGSPVHVSTNSHLYYGEAGELLGVEGIFRDMSERHTAAEKIQHHIDTLKESEEIFAGVAEHAPVPISIIEQDGTYRYVNNKFIETFGYDLNDFKTGREWFSLAFPDPVYRKNVIGTWKSDLEKYKSGTERPEIFTVRCKNGIDREIVFRPVTLSDMKQFVVYEDITQQKNAEYVQNLLSSIVETSPHAIITKKIDGTIISWNKAAEDLYGYRKDEIIGCNINTIIPEQRQGEIAESITRIKNGESRVHHETHRVQKDGKIIAVTETISLLNDESGKIIGASTVTRDISFKKTKEQPKESAEKHHEPAETLKAEIYHRTGDPGAGDPQIKTSGVLNPYYLSSALKMARDYIAILDRTGKCVWANDALIGAVNAASCTDLEGKSIALYITPEFRKVALDSLMEIKKTGNKTVQLMMLSSSGRVPVEANFSAINTEEGDLFGYMAIARNIGREKLEKPKQ